MLFFIDLKSSSVQEQSFKIRRKEKRGIFKFEAAVIITQEARSEPSQEYNWILDAASKTKGFPHSLI